MAVLVGTDPRSNVSYLLWLKLAISWCLEVPVGTGGSLARQTERFDGILLSKLGWEGPACVRAAMATDLQGEGLAAGGGGRGGVYGHLTLGSRTLDIGHWTLDYLDTGHWTSYYGL